MYRSRSGAYKNVGREQGSEMGGCAAKCDWARSERGEQAQERKLPHKQRRREFKGDRRFSLQEAK